MGKRMLGIAVLVAVLAGAASANPLIPPPLEYQGAFINPNAFGGSTNNYSGLAYYAGDVSNPGPRLYGSSWTSIHAIGIPATVIPDVGWTNLNTASTLVAPTVAGSYYNQGLRVRDDGVAGTHIYCTSWSSQRNAYTTLDLTSTTNTTNVTGAGGSSPVPTAFSVAAGGDAAMDTIYVLQPYFGSPPIYIGDADQGPQRRVLAFTSNPTGYGWAAGGWDAIEWIQPPGTTDWQDGFLVCAEKVGTTVYLSYFDPVQLAALGAAGGGVNPATTITPADLTRVDISGYMSPGLSRVVGVSYDPDTGQLFVAEQSSDPGSVVHVWAFPGGTPIPEPAGLSVLGLALLGLRKRRS